MLRIEGWRRCLCGWRSLWTLPQIKDMAREEEGRKKLVESLSQEGEKEGEEKEEGIEGKEGTGGKGAGGACP